jgi:hypothetical protein
MNDGFTFALSQLANLVGLHLFDGCSGMKLHVGGTVAGSSRLF